MVPSTYINLYMEHVKIAKKIIKNHYPRTEDIFARKPHYTTLMKPLSSFLTSGQITLLSVPWNTRNTPNSL